MTLQRSCRLCGSDISKRHWQAVYCFDCCYRANDAGGRKEARSAVNNAIKRGELQPANTLTCVDCGKQARDYDHRDYSKPLDVQPVCRSCNKKRGPGVEVVAA